MMFTLRVETDRGGILTRQLVQDRA